MKRMFIFGVFPFYVAVAPIEARISRDRNESASRHQIVVDLSDQRLWLLERGCVVFTARACTGKSSHRTPIGVFTIIRKREKYQSSAFGALRSRTSGRLLARSVDSRTIEEGANARFEGTEMKYYLEFEPGYGFHAGEVRSAPSSHGCVRLVPEAARRLFETVDVGCRVRIQR